MPPRIPGRLTPEMFARIARLYRAELTKLFLTWFPYVGLLASALMALAGMQSVRSMDDNGQATAGIYFATSVNLNTTLIMPIFALIISAMIVAGESTRGTLRTVLIRPVGRGEFLTAKFLTALTYMLAMMSANVVAAGFLAPGFPLVAKGDLSDPDMPDLARQIQIFATGIGLTLLPQIAVVAFGFLISVLVSNVATSIGLALGIFLCAMPLRTFARIESFDLNDYLFLEYFDTAMGIASSQAQGIYARWAQEDVYRLVGASLGSTLLCLAVAFPIFLRRDIND